jgi:8-oxo-dGTP pyrophosphatase MutT (NUDIX family)
VSERALPAWWQPLAANAGAVRAEQMSRWPVPREGGRPSAVLMLLGEGDGPELLLLERAATLRTHAGQPAFPGGATDPGDTGPVDTALREADEEVGLDRATVDVVAVLPELWLPPSNFVVTPVLGWWHSPHPVHARATAEVARVETVPIAELAAPEHRLRVRHPSGFVGPAFDVRGMLVWGFTAGLVAVLLDLGGWALPWDDGRVRELPPR